MNASETERCKWLIEGYGLKLADQSDITGEILRMMNGRGEHWLWVDRWIAEEAPNWRNDAVTFVFEVPAGNLVDRQALNFVQDVWMCQPRLFEHKTWGGRMFARLSWDRKYS